MTQSDFTTERLSATASEGRSRTIGGRGAAVAKARRRRSDGDVSRHRLVTAAGRLFASQGYAAVSTRALARAARVNLSAIAYYFGGKEGLYRAVLGRMIAESEPIMGPLLDALNRGLDDAGDDRARLARVVESFVRGLLDAILASDRLHWTMTLMLREFQQPSAVFPMLLDARIHPLHDAVARMIAAARGAAAETPETRLLAASVIGQCMALGAARAVVFARLGWDGYTPERVAFVGDVVTPAILRMIGLTSAAEGR